jgi:hypothetical protein
MTPASRLSLSLFATAAILASAVADAQAQRRSPVDDARDDIDEAEERAADDGRRCARRVVPILRDVKRTLRFRPTPPRLERALAGVEEAREAAGSCDRRVRRVLRSAHRSLEDALAEVGDRRRPVRPAPRPPAPRVVVPSRGWSVDCRVTWYMIEMIDVGGGASPADRAAVDRMRQLACQNPNLGELTWPSGRTARYRNGEWRYPNGRTARYANGELRYPNGRTAMYANGELRYPSGRSAKFANGEWRYPNGRRAGDWMSVEAWACGVSRDGCKRYRVHRGADDPVWRELALVREAWAAGGGR